MADSYGREIRYGEPLTAPADGTDLAEAQRRVATALDLSEQMASIEADWQKIQEIEDPHQRAWEFMPVAMNKALYFGGLMLMQQGDISAAEFAAFTKRASGQGGE